MTNVKLTGRDQALLYDCYSHAVMSFSQIHRRHFAGKSLPTVSNRLNQLRRAGYLVRISVSINLLLGNPNEVDVVWSVTKRALSFLKVCYPDGTIRDKPHAVSITGLKHDLLLNETLWALRMRYPDHKIVHGKLFPMPNGSGSRHPDAFFLGERGEPTVAVELELTAKEDARYRRIVIGYMTNTRYKKVVYVVGGNTISDRIKYQITHQKSRTGLLAPSTGKFHFVTLRELLKSPSQVSISNGSGELFD